MRRVEAEKVRQVEGIDEVEEVGFDGNLKTEHDITGKANPNAAYFSALAAQWEREHPMDEARMNAVRSIAWLAGVREDMSVLDLGCGTGVMVPAYKAMGAAHILGLDIAQGMIDRAQASYAGDGVVSFRCVDVMQFETDERFDAAVIHNAYPHFLDAEALAQKVASLLMPAGRFLVAHSMSRQEINAHHASVPHEICRNLEAAQQEIKSWHPFFDIDCIADTDRFYCFGGLVKG